MTALEDVHGKLLAYLSASMPDVEGLRVLDLKRMPEGWSRECFSFALAFRRHGEAERHELILRAIPPAALSTRTVALRRRC